MFISVSSSHFFAMASTLTIKFFGVWMKTVFSEQLQRNSTLGVSARYWRVSHLANFMIAVPSPLHLPPNLKRLSMLLLKQGHRLKKPCPSLSLCLKA